MSTRGCVEVSVYTRGPRTTQLVNVDDNTFWIATVCCPGQARSDECIFLSSRDVLFGILTSSTARPLNSQPLFKLCITWNTVSGGGVVAQRYRVSNFRPRGHAFDPRSGRSCVTILGKLFTHTFLDAESLRYYMESLNWVP